MTNTLNAGPGSLRQAILDANALQNSGGGHCVGHSIVFNIPGSGVHTIQTLSGLPTFNIPININGYTQPGSIQNNQFQGSNAVLTIELDGSLAGPTDAIVIGSNVTGSPLCPGSNSEIRGLVINRFAGAAISMGEQFCAPTAFCSVGGVVIQGNYFGTDATGNVGLGNGFGLSRPTLVFGLGSTNNIVGDQITSAGGPIDALPMDRNVISAGAADAIYIGSSQSNALSQAHRIRNNYIGTSASGTVALGNGGRGITVAANASNIAIYDNLISNNGSDGVAIFDSSTVGTAVIGNGIGIGLNAVAMGNAGHGVIVAGGARAVTVGARFKFAPPFTASIANNAGAGVFVDDFAQADVGNASISGNGGLAIDLAPLGVTPNDPLDADNGPNELLNKPVIASAIFDAATSITTISGSLAATPNTTYTILFFRNTDCDASGYGGGQTLLSFSPPPSGVVVTTDASGNASFVRQTSYVPANIVLTALTRTFASTTPAALIVSEFSACRQVVSTADRIFMTGFDP
ncbi:MAG: right-handed parallel beta-helix repeat-containing protein [Dokdonella sp.]